MRRPLVAPTRCALSTTSRQQAPCGASLGCWQSVTHARPCTSAQPESWRSPFRGWAAAVSTRRAHLAPQSCLSRPFCWTKRASHQNVCGALAAMRASSRPRERQAHLALRWPHDHGRSGVDDVLAPTHRLVKGPSVLQVGLRCRADQLSCLLAGTAKLRWTGVQAAAADSRHLEDAQASGSARQRVEVGEARLVAGVAARYAHGVPAG